MRVVRMPQDIWRVSLFLINTATMADLSRPSTDEHLFQPQIRVVCRPGTSLLPLRQALHGSDAASEIDSLVSEDESLGLVYRNSSTMARGHLCGAIWGSIDPERPHPRVAVSRQGSFCMDGCDRGPRSGTE